MPLAELQSVVDDKLQVVHKRDADLSLTCLRPSIDVLRRQDLLRFFLAQLKLVRPVLFSIITMELKLRTFPDNL
jgi:hypothetical protein